MKDQFTINRHALQMHIPQLPNGDIDCIEDGQRRYAKADFSKGFPDWFYFQRMDIHVPSQHTQDGTRYAGELVLAHFYEQQHVKNQVRSTIQFAAQYGNTTVVYPTCLQLLLFLEDCTYLFFSPRLSGCRTLGIS